MPLPAPLDQSPVARYLQLATLFRSRIVGGTWKVGERVPSIVELANEFAVSRETIRGAMDLLEDEGLVERFRAKGSFVRAAPSPLARHRLEADWPSMISAHEGAQIEVLESATVAALPPAAQGAGTPLPEYRMMRRRHLRDGKAYLVGRLYVDPAIHDAAAERFRREPTLPILHDLAGERIGRASQLLTIGTADVELAALLGVPLNAPIAEVARRAIDVDGRLVYFGLGLYRGDAIRLEIDLR